MWSLQRNVLQEQCYLGDVQIGGWLRALQRALAARIYSKASFGLKSWQTQLVRRCKVLWDCQRHLHHWEHHWSQERLRYVLLASVCLGQEKQYWCCTHDHIARQVCAHVSVEGSHLLLTGPSGLR